MFFGCTTHSLGDLSSPKDRPCTPAVEVQSRSCWTSREIPSAGPPTRHVPSLGHSFLICQVNRMVSEVLTGAKHPAW